MTQEISASAVKKKPIIVFGVVSGGMGSSKTANLLMAALALQVNEVILAEDSSQLRETDIPFVCKPLSAWSPGELNRATNKPWYRDFANKRGKPPRF